MFRYMTKEKKHGVYRMDQVSDEIIDIESIDKYTALLDPPQDTIILMRLAEFSFREIAQELGLEIGVVKGMWVDIKIKMQKLTQDKLLGYR